ncbi:MAG: cell envelope integrity protein TolA [Acidobacteriaceae bacterium]
MPIRITPTSEELDQPLAEPSASSSSKSPAGDREAVPEQPSTNGSSAVAAFRHSRYEEYDHTDLLHVIDELEGSRNWVSLREKLWIALIVHMLIAWYLFYGPKYIYHVRVVDPSVVMKQRQKELTFLDMPPDLLKQPKPKPTNIISDKNRVAQSQHPTIDKKTLEELEAMRRAQQERPNPAPAEQPAPTPAPPAPQQAQQQAPARPAQPLPQNNQARLEAPPPAAPQPNFRTGPANPNEQLQQAMQNAMHNGGGQYSGQDGLGAPSQHPGMNGAVDVLSDTMGVDFGPYIERVIYDTKRAWYPIIPESARPPLDKKGVVQIRFKILPDGTVTDMHLEGPSGDVSLDRAAWAGITGAAPYGPLPKAFKGPFLELRFAFLYNLRPGQD